MKILDFGLAKVLEADANGPATIRARVDGLAANLLRRHVADRAEDHARGGRSLRNVGRGFSPAGLGGPEGPPYGPFRSYPRRFKT